MPPTMNPSHSTHCRWMTTWEVVSALLLAVMMPSAGAGAWSYQALNPGNEATAPGAKTDQDKLQGSWDIVALQVDGVVMPQMFIWSEKPTTVFTGDKFRVRIAGKGLLPAGQSSDSTFRLDPSQKPKAIDVTEEGHDGLQTLKGIYMLDGDSLTICVAFKGEDRPKEFKVKAKSSTMLMVLKRPTAALPVAPARPAAPQPPPPRKEQLMKLFPWDVLRHWWQLMRPEPPLPPQVVPGMPREPPPPPEVPPPPASPQKEKQP
jgi:uncharacterized protein (TIGR03067 family)